jgi:HEPN domain-containing protein
MPGPVRTRTVEKNLHRNFLRKSEEFLDSASHAQRQGNHDACVSAAVHSAICAVDALTTFYLGVRHAGESHGEALMLLRRVKLPADEIERVERHFSAMLQTKRVAEYEDRFTSAAEGESVMKHLQRLRSIILASLQAR